MQIPISSSHRVGRTQFNSWSIPFPVGLALLCGISLGVLSRFRGADRSLQVSTETSLVLPGSCSLRSPLCLPLLVLSCQRSGCFSANFRAFLSYTANSPLLPWTLIISNPSRLRRILLFWTRRTVAPLWVCHHLCHASI